jgi:hypothetical protein
MSCLSPFQKEHPDATVVEKEPLFVDPQPQHAFDTMFAAFPFQPFLQSYIEWLNARYSSPFD